MSPIPTNVITGFLGVGKTTAILELLKRKPAQETWAVLVNEFGEVGIDGSMLAQEGAVIREVAGGCMCCVAGLPMQIGLNMLIAKAKPQRLLVEPTGLGHPAQILSLLRGDAYREHLDVRAAVCLIDPRKLADPRYRENDNFLDQARVADILLANKVDLSDQVALDQFQQWAAGFQPPKAAIGTATRGQLPLAWLDLPNDPERLSGNSPAAVGADVPKVALNLMGLLGKGGSTAQWRRAENRGQGYASCGWVFSADHVFSHSATISWLSGLEAVRLKAVLRTEQGWYAFNSVDGVLSSTAVTEAPDSRIEFIQPDPYDWTDTEQQLFNCLNTPLSA